MDPTKLSQEDRQYLWEAAGHSGIAPVGYGGEGGMTIGAGGGIAPAPFTFDYAKAAEDAYGELGPYYLRILTESQGDLNKALSRLTEDYDRGIRTRREDTATANNATARGNVANALARGLYQRSNFEKPVAAFMASPEDPYATPQAEGFGIADLVNPNNTAGNTIAQRNLEGKRAETEATITKQRQEVDLPEAQKRREFALEQERREKAAALSETRGARAYQDYQAKQIASPSYV